MMHICSPDLWEPELLTCIISMILSTQTVPLWIFVKQTCLGSIWNSFEDNMDVLEILKYQSILIQHMIQIYFLFLSVQLSTG